ncbi:creatininase family protein [Paenibacillus agricola]|uniref:Creatininase family protein n=1 Tax=Paenibacillus agricola TaxID=2716264 RepID=A0ABX0IY64_9BACL|nr:creatininase family protein [Paenibacillus agricola]NHN28895.1 creatininase family protein [Paenibacillus agricola]
MFRYEGKAWEERFLPRLSSLQIKQLAKDDALVILPVGAVEQHGWHMPVMTDALIGEALLTQTMDLLPEETNVWLLPPISYGKSNEHLDYAGTFSLSSATLLHVLSDIGASVKRNGFRRLLLFNTHGGNVDLLNVAAREIRVSTGLMVFYVNPHSLDTTHDLVSEEELEYGIHGGDIETSMLMAIKPNWVQEELRVSEMPDVSQLEFLTLEGKIRFAWVMSDISQSGIAGDATKATAEKGEVIMQRSASELAKAMQELCRFEISQVLPKVKHDPFFNNRIEDGGGH